MYVDIIYIGDDCSFDSVHNLWLYEMRGFRGNINIYSLYLQDFSSFCGTDYSMHQNIKFVIMHLYCMSIYFMEVIKF